jgi:hypothetical protein
MFTENEDTFTEHEEGEDAFLKDAFHRRVVNGDVDATNPENFGTKAGLQYTTAVAPKGSATFRFRLFNPAEGADAAAEAVVVSEEDADELGSRKGSGTPSRQGSSTPSRRNRRGEPTTRPDNGKPRKSSFEMRTDIDSEFVCPDQKRLEACDLDTEAITLHGQVILVPRRFGSDVGAEKFPGFGLWFESMFATRKREANEFYDEVRDQPVPPLPWLAFFYLFLPDVPDRLQLSAHFPRVISPRFKCPYFKQIFAPSATEGERRLARLAYAGMLCSKQFYYYSVAEWLKGDPHKPAPPKARKDGRNRDWKHRE